MRLDTLLTLLIAVGVTFLFVRGYLKKVNAQKSKRQSTTAAAPRNSAMVV